MTVTEISFALLTGIVSAVFYSAIQSVYKYIKWLKTKRYFISRIRNQITSINYNLMTILDIDAIYETEFEPDHLIEDHEFVSKIESMEITGKQWDSIDKLIKLTKERIAEKTKEGLLVSTYTSTDFHSVDSLTNKMQDFTSTYSWLDQDLDNPDVVKNLKEKLLVIVTLPKLNPFPNKPIDRIYNKFRNKFFKYKHNDNTIEDENIPF